MSQYKVHNSSFFFFSSYVQHTSVLKNKTNNESSAVDSELMVTLMLLHLFTAFSVVLPAYLSDCLSTITVCQTFSYVIHASQHRMKLFGGQLSVCLSIWEQPKVILTLKQFFFFLAFDKNGYLLTSIFHTQNTTYSKWAHVCFPKNPREKNNSY